MSAVIRQQLGRSRVALETALTVIKETLDRPYDKTAVDVLKERRAEVVQLDVLLRRHYDGIQDRDAEWTAMANQDKAELKIRSDYMEKYGSLSGLLLEAEATHLEMKREVDSIDQAIKQIVEQAQSTSRKRLDPIPQVDHGIDDDTLRRLNLSQDPFNGQPTPAPAPRTVAPEQPMTKPVPSPRRSIASPSPVAPPNPPIAQTPRQSPEAAVGLLSVAPTAFLNCFDPQLIPLFDGKFHMYPTFIKSFNSLISTYPLPSISKFHLLKSRLRGTALEAIANLDLTEENFSLALSILNSRFSDRNISENRLLSELHLIKTSLNSSEDLRRTYDSINRILAQLETLGTDINCPVFLSIIQTKFPPQIVKHLLLLQQSSPLINMRAILSKINEVIQIEERLKYLTLPERPHNQLRQSFQNPHYANARFPPDQSRRLSNSNGPNPYSNRFTPQNYSNDFKPPLPFLCPYCNHQHKSFQCTAVPLEEKKRIVVEKNLCSVCLSQRHTASQCTSSYLCKLCRTRHHISLCPQNSPPPSGTPIVPKAQPLNRFPSQSNNIPLGKQNPFQKNNQVPAQNPFKPKADQTRAINLVSHSSNSALPICKVVVTAPTSLENYQPVVNCHAILDSGSNRTFITHTLAKALHLTPKSVVPMSISKFSCAGKEFTETPEYEIIITTPSGQRLNINAFGIDCITSPVSVADIHPKNLAYTPISQSVEIHVQFSHALFWTLVKSKPQFDSSSQDYFIDTLLGPIYVPGWSPQILDSISLTTLITKVDQPSLDSSTKLIHLDKSPSGRYVASFPWNSTHEIKDDVHENICLHQLRSLIKRLESRGLLPRYEAYIQDLIEKEFIIERSPAELSQNMHAKYCPHIPVFNEMKDKLRIVFNGSYHTKNSSSVNDRMDKGINLIPNVSDIILLFRQLDNPLIGDLRNAFNTIELSDDSSRYTCFLWVRDLNKPIERSNTIHYRWSRLPFGFAASPFVLLTALHHLLSTHGDLGKALLQGLYIDNFVVSAADEAEAFELFQTIDSLFSSAGFQVHEWWSTLPIFNTWLMDQGITVKPPKKFLGISFDFASDCFTAKLPKISEPPSTRRQILSSIASIFCPDGVFEPVILHLRLLYQELLEFPWDKPLSSSIVSKWTKIFNDWESICLIYPRKIEGNLDSEGVLVTFCDASCKARGCVSYLVVNSKVFFLRASSRVSPTKSKQSIPNLESSAFEMALVQQNSLRSSLIHVNVTQSIIYSDSTTTLAWMSGEKPVPGRKNSFIANTLSRSKKFLSEVEPRFCPGSENISDIVSRGCTASKLASLTSWILGPDWLQNPDLSPPSTEIPLENATETAISLTSITQSQIWRKAQPPLIDFDRFSSFLKVLKVIFVCVSFILKKCPSVARKLTPELFRSFNDAKTREWLWNKFIFLVQNSVDIPLSLQRDAKLFIDHENVVRQKTRRPLPSDNLNTNNPAYLPKCHATQLLVLYFHQSNGHPSAEHVFHLLRLDVFIPKPRSFIKSCINSFCFNCKLLGAKPFHQPPFPSFPQQRFTKSHPFNDVGIDIFGPIDFRSAESTSILKGYGLLICCLTIRAVHVELMPSATAEAILNALRRFIHIRGCPSVIRSDNGKGFVVLSQFFNDNEVPSYTLSSSISSFLADHGIKWLFTPPLSPWAGGYFERLIGLVKRALKYNIGRRVLTWDQLTSALAQATSVVNSRPLCYIPTDETPVLSPNDFIGVKNPSLPVFVSEDLHEDPDYHTPSSYQAEARRLTQQWSQEQSRLKKLWKFWSESYVSTLQSRIETDHQNVVGAKKISPEVGEVVLLKDETVPPGIFRKGVITAVNSMPPRTVNIRTLSQGGNPRILTRPVGKVCSLEIRSFLSVSLILSLFVCLSTACTETISIMAHHHECIDNNSSLSCSVRTSLSISVDSLSSLICIQFRNKDGTANEMLKIKINSFRFLGQKTTVAYTRDHELRVATSHRCYGVKSSQCQNWFCSEVSYNTTLKDLPPEANENFGFSHCRASCGCLLPCLCFSCDSSCLFYRVYSYPLSDLVYHLYEISSYDPLLFLSLDSSFLNDSITVKPTEITRAGNISFTLASYSISPFKPFYSHFLSHYPSNRTIVIPDVVFTSYDSPKSLICPNEEAAKSIQNCYFSPKQFDCSNDFFSPHCSLSFPKISHLFERDDLRLPFSRSGSTLRVDEDDLVVDTKAALDLRLTIDQVVQLVVHNATCVLYDFKVTGCFDCAKQPELQLNCSTTFGTTKVIFVCDAIEIYPIQCNNSQQRYVTQLRSKTPTVDAKCRGSCAANTVEFNLKGTLKRQSPYLPNDIEPLNRKKEVESENWLEYVSDAWNSFVSNIYLKGLLAIGAPLALIAVLVFCFPQIMSCCWECRRIWRESQKRPPNRLSPIE